MTIKNIPIDRSLSEHAR